MFLDVDDADLQAKLLKANSPKWFCHDVRQLIVSVDMPDGDLPVLNAFPDEMESRLDVFAPAMEDRVLAELNRRLVVNEELSGRRRLAVEAPKQSSEPN